jgi:hypothetical protein
MQAARRSRPRTFLLPALLVVGALPLVGAACSTKAPTRSSVQTAVGVVDLPARRIRLAADHTGGMMMTRIEIAADSIIRATDDPDVRRNALAWKANAIPAIQTATHHPDPFVAFVDGWVFAVLMRDYFNDGRGRDLFGPQQPIARAAMQDIVDRIESNTRRALEEGHGDYGAFEDFVTRYTATYPIDNDLYVHRTVAAEVVDVLGEQEFGGLGSLGSMEEMALDAQTMARAYLAYTFKTVLWQTELMIESMMDTTLITPLLDSVDRMAVTSAATRLLESTPGMVASERARILAETERMLDASLDRAFAQVDEERGLILAEVEAMVARERQVIFDELRALTPEISRQVREEAIAVVDHLLLRLAIGMAILLVLLAAGWLLLRPRRRATSA